MRNCWCLGSTALPATRNHSALEVRVVNTTRSRLRCSSKAPARQKGDLSKTDCSCSWLRKGLHKCRSALLSLLVPEDVRCVPASGVTTAALAPARQSLMCGRRKAMLSFAAAPHVAHCLHLVRLSVLEILLHRGRRVREFVLSGSFQVGWLPQLAHMVVHGRQLHRKSRIRRAATLTDQGPIRA